jgi:hypothetical protein
MLIYTVVVLLFIHDVTITLHISVDFFLVFKLLCRALTLNLGLSDDYRCPIPLSYDASQMIVRVMMTMTIKETMMDDTSSIIGQFGILGRRLLGYWTGGYQYIGQEAIRILDRRISVYLTGGNQDIGQEDGRTLDRRISGYGQEHNR